MEQNELDNLLYRHEMSLKGGIRSGESVTLDLSNVNLDGCLIKNRPMLNGLDLSNSNLEMARIENCNLNGVSFQHARCQGIRITSTYLNGADFSYSEMRNAQINGCNQDTSRHKATTPVNFRQADLTRAQMHMSNFDGATFEGAHMEQTYWRFVSVNHANLNDANLSRCETMHVNMEDSTCIGLIGRQAQFKGLSLDRSNLTDSDLSMSSFDDGGAGPAFSFSSLSEVTLTGSNLHGTSFHNCSFRNSTLGAYTEDKRLSNVRATHAYFSGCAFDNVTAESTRFDYARFTDCSLLQTIFLHASFKGAVLDSCYSLIPGNTFPHSAYMETDHAGTTISTLWGKWNKDFNRTLGIWGEQNFYSALLDIATLYKINDVLKRVGQKGRVEFGASNKLKWVDYGPDRLFNPHEHGKSTEGRIYKSMIQGYMPNKDYKMAQSDVITPNNIDTFSVGNILYAICWLRCKKVDDY